MTIMKIMKFIKLIYFADYPACSFCYCSIIQKLYYEAIGMKNKHKYGRPLYRPFYSSTTVLASCTAKAYM